MKLKIGIAGISGRIGRLLVDILSTDNTAVVQCGLVSKNSKFSLTDIAVDSVCAKADIWIDFSSADAFAKVLKHCVKTKTPLVTGTTGLGENHFKEMQQAAVEIPILWAANFAISINLIQNLLANYSKLQVSAIKITETHHLHKADKPSGTAISMARSINPHGIIKKLTTADFELDGIAIKAIRQAEVTGIHQIELDSNLENISISHTAKDPKIFAQGAINVAKWLVKQNHGLYTMADYIESLDA